jgi:hypothetical protein
MTPEQRSSRAVLAADMSWAKTRDRTARTAPGHAAAEARFMTQAREMHGADTPEADLAKCAESLRKAHFRRMAMASAKAKRARKTT